MNEKHYDPKGVIPKEFDEEGQEADRERNDELFEAQDNTLFHIGQYGTELATTIVCKHCGSNKFNVGIGSYYTAIRCEVCEWESRIHEG